MLEIRLYSCDQWQAWNQFIASAKNAHFMFNRGFMEYHKQRFIDFSLMIFDQNKLIAVLPANRKQDTLYSHQGLSFAGLIVDTMIRTKQVLDCFTLILDYLRANNIRKIVYKCVPYIYHKLASDEDRYALFINNFQLIRRDVSTSIFLSAESRLGYSDLRKRSVKKAIKSGLSVKEQVDFRDYWSVLEQILFTNYQTTPVHSYAEIQELRDSFPTNIRLFVAQNCAGEVLAGVVLFIAPPVIHTQYLAATTEGRAIGALDIVIDYLLNHEFAGCQIFDFGISNENEGRYLNEGLISQKEGFGARAIVHDFYELAL